MQRRFILLIMVVFMMGSFLFPGELTLGEKIVSEKVTQVSEILAKPGDFIDKVVRVEGYIVDGCMHEGRWISIAGDKDFEQLSIWDKEGKITFPLEHKGKYAIIEGTIYGIKLTEEQAIKWQKHLADTHKQEVDLEKAKGGMTIYRLSPTGAIIKDSK
ncbi:MAG: hypothetical protein MUF15_06375 [Acidobacteria bacterium]|jgi:hypothetical protein|nr:hypothetical protein [Acidobacteriota bacterium]